MEAIKMATVNWRKRIVSFLLVTFLVSPALSDDREDKKLKVPDAKVIMCEALPAPAAGGACDVSQGSKALLIKGNILDIETVHQGGEVLIDETGLIHYVGCSANRPAELNVLAEAATSVTCPEGAVSPGLINAHDHMTYNHSFPFPETEIRFNHRNEWRQYNPPEWDIGIDNSQEKVTWSELRQVMTGTTSIAGAYAKIGFLRNLDAPWYSYPLYDDLLWNLYSEGPTQIVTDTFPLENDDEYQQNEGDCSTYTYLGKSKNFYTDVYVPHIGEGVNAAANNEYKCISSTDRNGTDIVDGSFSMVHGIALDAHDCKNLADDRAALIWSPRSNIFLYGNTAPVSMLKNRGVLIALSTDWIPSGSMNLGRELICADELNRNYLDNTFSDRELWLMATYNSAIALHVDEKIGSLRPGLFGDIAIYDGQGKENPYRAVIEADAKSTVLVLRRSSMPFALEGPNYIGSIALYGDANILQSLPATEHEEHAILYGFELPLCEHLDVCGADKLVCPLRETWWAINTLSFNPLNLEELTTANTDSYPLFFCEDPPDEPSCMPFRPGEYAGVLESGPASTSDSDGDGIPDNLDNCKKVFNPIRPMDNGVQADADGDGKGDACDKCPLDEGPICSAIDPYSGSVVDITDG
jgi:hypothetical protein